MRSFIDALCLRVLRWFAVASADSYGADWCSGSVSRSGGYSFIRAASFVGHLIESGLLRHELVRRHLFKPLTTHYYNSGDIVKQAIRANAIYQLFTVAGDTLLRGLLEPEDVQVCFERLDVRVSFGGIAGLDALDVGRLNVRDSHLGVCVRIQLVD